MSLRLGLIVAVLLTPAVTAAEPGAPLTAPPAAHLTAEVLFADPTMSEPKLSPDGQSLAFVLAKNRFQRVFVRPVVGTQFVGIAEFPTDEVRLRWLAWGSSTRVLLSGLAPDPSAKRLQPWVTRLYSASIEKPRLRWLGKKWSARGPDWPTWQARYEDRVVSLLPGEADAVLVSHLDYGKRTPSISKMNIYSGRLRSRHQARDGVRQWYPDATGLVRAAESSGESADGKSYQLLARKSAKSKLVSVFETDDNSASRVRFTGFHEKPHRVYLIADHEGRDALFEYDIDAKDWGALVFAHPTFDVVAAHFSVVHKKVVGAEYVGERREIVEYFDDEAATEHASIALSLKSVTKGETTSRIVSATRDASLAIVEVSGPTQPPTYYAYNRTKKEMNFIFDQRPELVGASLLPSDVVRFASRDGVELSGVVTKPKASAGGAGPMLVLLRDEIERRSALQYDPVLQWFAGQGLTVLQVNHRGSVGFGREFAEVSTAQMLSDIEDGVAWAVSEGIADPKAIGIYGTGVGGELATRALVAAPERYRAGAVFGVRSSGEPTVETGAIVAPMLIGHGTQSLLAPIKGARDLEFRLRTAGNRVELVEYRDEFDSLVSEANRIDFNKRLLAFFAEHLKRMPADSYPDPQVSPLP